jgi:drug/metabolite transporter (DMT)-like permease
MNPCHQHVWQPYPSIYFKVIFYCFKKRPLRKFFNLAKSFAGWILFIILAIIWGSSFILMKLGMQALSAYQVASIRILSAAIILVPFGWKAFKNVAKEKRFLVILSGLLGSFFPAFLYCIAETKIDSSLAAILNSLTPLFTIIIGVTFFKLTAGVKKIIGVIIGFTGLILLPFATHRGISFNDLSYASLVLLATICYACNVNMVSRYLGQTPSLYVAALSFSFLLIPAYIILTATGYFQLPLLEQTYLHSTLAAALLGIMGTAVATVLFYMLVKKEGPLFASLVTYGIPIIAVIWGLLYGETITLAEIGCLIIILAGVYMVNKK